MQVSPCARLPKAVNVPAKHDSSREGEAFFANQLKTMSRHTICGGPDIFESRGRHSWAGWPALGRGFGEGMRQLVEFRLPRPTAYTLAELVLIALIAIQAARLAWILVTPIGPVGDWKATGALAAPADASALASFDPFFRLDGAAGPAVVTSLNLKLYGVREDRATGRGLGDHRPSRRPPAQFRGRRGDHARRNPDRGRLRQCHDQPRRHGRADLPRPVAAGADGRRARDGRARAGRARTRRRAASRSISSRGWRAARSTASSSPPAATAARRSARPASSPAT